MAIKLPLKGPIIEYPVNQSEDFNKFTNFLKHDFSDVNIIEIIIKLRLYSLDLVILT